MELVLGADIGGTSVKFIVCGAGSDLTGEVPTDPHDPAATLARLAATVRGRLAAPARSLSAVGLACAGIVSPADGRLGRSPNLPGWERCELVSLARAAFGTVPVTAANDVNAAVYGEWRQGAGRGHDDLVMIALGTGVGGGIIAGGRLLLGARGVAAEIGHMTLDPAGPPCRCGNRGCLEAYAGAIGLRRRAGEIAAAGGSAAFRALAAAGEEALDLEAAAALARGGDATARAFFAAAGRWLGLAAANCVNLLDPGLVIIGGGIAQAGELILESCRQEVRRRVLAEQSRGLPVVVAQLGPLAAAIGAVEMARARWREQT